MSSYCVMVPANTSPACVSYVCSHLLNIAEDVEEQRKERAAHAGAFDVGDDNALSHVCNTLIQQPYQCRSLT